MSGLVACTIVARNYVPMARVLARSFREHVPDGKFVLLLVDRNEGFVDPVDEPFDEVVEVEQLDTVPDLPSFLFKYTILEAMTAVKPYFLEWLFRDPEVEKLLYFDPDIRLFRRPELVESVLDDRSIVLTPHITTPVDDGRKPSEVDLLRAGTYNLGFLGLRRSSHVERLLPWWQDRLYDRCRVEHDHGLFVDQKWIDLVPGLFPDVRVIDHPGHNVAYWNFHGRTVESRDGEWTVNGEPLVFFHFSGIDVDDLEAVSKHQDRFVMTDLGEVGTLYRDYRDRLLAEGFREGRGTPYAFGAFDDGTPIPDLARRLYARAGERRTALGDPFQIGTTPSVLGWLNEAPRGRGESGRVSRLLWAVWSERPDLQSIFPHPDGGDLPGFAAWVERFGRAEYRLPAPFVEPVRGASAPWSIRDLAGTARAGLKRLFHSRLGRSLRRRFDVDARRQARRAGSEPEVAPPVLPELGGYRPARPRATEAHGVNVIGYFRAETGMGEVARGLARAFEAAGISVTRHDLDLNVLARRDDGSAGELDTELVYDVNLFAVNADQVGPVYRHLGPAAFAGRHNVGFWLWELESFPSRWRGAFDLFHEVWTPSRHCLAAIGEISPVPVRLVPLPIDDVQTSHDRAHFGIDPDRFVVLSTFSFLSYAERKNPWGAIEAFRRAFGDDVGAELVLKTSQADFDPESVARLEAAVGGATVRRIDRYLDRDEVRSLTAISDASLSLHRAEGFGLTVAEAMWVGTPAVATDYSGVTDFFGVGRGFPVRYDLVELERDAGPYPAGARWAEPDLDDAAEQLRRIREGGPDVESIVARAMASVRRELSDDAVGAILERRLASLRRIGG